MKKHLRLIISFFAMLMIFTASANSKEVNDKNYCLNLQIINSKNKEIHDFKIKIVKGASEMEEGLMFITNLPKNYGMLFEFSKNEVVYMWMKNTKISLDMIFIDQDNKIVSIKHSAVPESEKIISSLRKVNKVLEINGGLCKELGIGLGDKIVIVSN